MMGIMPLSQTLLVDIRPSESISIGAPLTLLFNSAMIPPTLYYSKVGLELGKLVFRGQNMTPP